MWGEKKERKKSAFIDRNYIIKTNKQERNGKMWYCKLRANK